MLETLPGRHQYLFVLSAPIQPAHAQCLSARLAHAIAADPSGADLTQLMRVPDTANWKYEPAPTVTLVTIADRQHDPDEVERRLPPLSEPERERTGQVSGRAPPTDGTVPPVRLRGYALAVWQGRHPVIGADGTIDRSASLWPIAKDLYRAGASVPTVAAALAGPSGPAIGHGATAPSGPLTRGIEPDLGPGVKGREARSHHGATTATHATTSRPILRPVQARDADGEPGRVAWPDAGPSSLAGPGGGPAAAGVLGAGAGRSSIVALSVRCPTWGWSARKPPW